MMTNRRRALYLCIGVVVIAFGYVTYFKFIVNPRVIDELNTDPNGARAEKVALLYISDEQTIPVNYLLEGNTAFVGSDFGWWRAFTGTGADVGILIKGQRYAGHGQAIVDNIAYRDQIFARLRPSAPSWLPEWAKGVLVEITLRP